MALAGGNTLEKTVIPAHFLHYSGQDAAETHTITTLSPFTPIPAHHLPADSHTTHFNPGESQEYKSHPEEKGSTYIPSVRELLKKYHGVLESVNVNTGVTDTTHSFIDVVKVKTPAGNSESSERSSQIISTDYPVLSTLADSYINILSDAGNDTHINETRNTHVSNINSLASFPGGLRFSNVSLEEAESRDARLTELIPNRTKKFRRRGKTVGRFTGVSRPMRLLPPAQWKNVTTQIPLYNIPGNHNLRRPSIRARKAKVRFGRKRTYTNKENGSQQELLQPVTVTKRPHAQKPFPLHPQYVVDMVEFGRKNMKAVEELSKYVGDKKNNTHYPQQLRKFLGPTLAIRKYKVSDTTPKSVIVRHMGQDIQAPRDSPQVEGVPAVQPPRSPYRAKPRRVISRASNMGRYTGVTSPSPWTSDPRVISRQYVGAPTPLPARIPQRGPPVYFLPSKSRGTPPWSQGQNFFSQESTETETETEAVITPVLSPPPYHNTASWVSEPFSSTTPSNEVFTPTPPRPVNKRKRRPSARRARQPRPSTLYDNTHNQVCHCFWIYMSSSSSSSCFAVPHHSCSSPSGHPGNHQ